MSLIFSPLVSVKLLGGSCLFIIIIIMDSEKVRKILRSYNKLKKITVLSYSLKKYQDALENVLDKQESINIKGYYDDIYEILEDLIKGLSDLELLIEEQNKEVRDEK